MPRRPVVPPEEVAALLLEGFSTRQVAAEFGISPATVNKYAHEEGLTAYGGKWHTPQTTEPESLFDQLASIVGSIFNPPPPEPPSVPERQVPGFDRIELPPEMRESLDDGRRHMELTFVVHFKPGVSDVPYVGEVKILQYDDINMIMATILAKNPDLNVEDIEAVEIYDYDEYYDELDSDWFEEFVRQGTTPGGRNE